MSRAPRRVLGGACVAGLTVSALVSSHGTAVNAQRNDQHVLLISVDGLHQSDLQWYITTHPYSALADLVGNGAEYTNAQTPVVSDSFPGMVAQVTGGDPTTTGVYYDDTWNHGVFPAGTTSCTGTPPGAEVTYFEQLDLNPLSIDAGQGLANLPDSILQMTGTPRTLIDTTQLPVDPTTCKPIYPDSYMLNGVNTIFEVARARGLRTAWSDKHAAYEILGGRSQAIQDLFTPEINSNASTSGAVDWTKDNALTQIYDGYKVKSVLNEIDGFDHSRSRWVGTPAIFGMNFQTVSTAEKLPGGGYHTTSAGLVPDAMLEGALDYINAKVGVMVDELRSRGLADNTTIILSAKHGQAPEDGSTLTRIDDGKLVNRLNADWNAAGHAGTLVAFSVDDDAVLMWLSDRSQTALDFAKTHLLSYSGTGTDITGASKAFTASGLAQVYAYTDPADPLFVPASDTAGRDRTPDIFGVTQDGVVYTGGKGKIAEHGGAHAEDRHVPLVVSNENIGGMVSNASVETTQIAPTILKLLGLDPKSLVAVQLEGTKVLPGI